ncbi:MAG: transposase [Acidobacteriota bacterium]|nr:transposase [Acidobacteriota bacterium]
MFSDSKFYETTVVCSPQSALRLINQKNPLLYFYIVLTAENARFKPAAREKFNSFLAATICATGGLPEAVGGKDDKIHLLVAFNSIDTQPADFIRRLKLLSANWARRKTDATDFAWSEKVQAITIGDAQRERVRRRILNQSKPLQVSGGNLAALETQRIYRAAIAA